MYLEKLDHLPIEKCEGERNVSVASWLANAATEGKRKYSSNPFARRH